MIINTDFVTRCIRTSETAFEQLQQHDAGDVAYDIFRAACVKEEDAKDMARVIAENPDD